MDRVDADKLILILEADVGEGRLRGHLDSGTEPNSAAMIIFAGLSISTWPGDAAH